MRYNQTTSPNTPSAMPPSPSVFASVRGIRIALMLALLAATGIIHPAAAEESVFTPEFVQLSKDLAAGGDADAQYNLGLAHYNGWGVTQSYTQAVKWYTRASEQAQVNAHFNLALMYDYGNGVEQDYEKAAKWYLPAARQGHAKAQLRLGVLYDNGWGVAKDKVEAARWYRLAARQNIAEAQFNLGMLHHNGEGMAQNYQKASDEFSRAAEHGHTKAGEYRDTISFQPYSHSQYDRVWIPRQRQ